MGKYNIPISDHGVVNFCEIENERIRVQPMYFELGFSTSPEVLGREAVLRRLLRVLPHLPNNYGLLVWDIYRPREVQGKLFEWMRNEVKKRSPSLSDADNYTESVKYMSAPSKIGDKYCPPHLSGGAIDLTLFEVDSGLKLDMGTVFDDCSEMAGRDYFNKKPNLFGEEVLIQQRRNLLRKLMEDVGFTSYCYEWWHFDIGNIFWGKELELDPVFGPLFGDAEWPKDLTTKNALIK